MTRDPSKASPKAMRAALSLAELLVEYDDKFRKFVDWDPKLKAGLAAYRAETDVKLRTRAEVAEQTLETLQRYLLISETNEGECSDILAATWTNLEELAGEMTCAESTAPEGEERAPLLWCCSDCPNSVACKAARQCSERWEPIAPEPSLPTCPVCGLPPLKGCCDQ